MIESVENINMKNIYSLTFRFYDDRKCTRRDSRDAVNKCFNKYKKNNQWMVISPDYDLSPQIQFHFNCVLKSNYIKGYLYSYKIKSLAKEDGVYAQIDPCDSVQGCLHYSHARYAQYLLKRYKFPDEYILFFKSIIDSKQLFRDAWHDIHEKQNNLLQLSLRNALDSPSFDSEGTS